MNDWTNKWVSEQANVQYWLKSYLKLFEIVLNNYWSMFLLNVINLFKFSIFIISSVKIWSIKILFIHSLGLY